MKTFRSILMFIVVATTSVLCEDVENNDQSTKIKRAASIGSYSYTSEEFAKHNNANVKKLISSKNVEVPKIVQESFVPMPIKTTVEFWPPDMDKQKFYNLNRDSMIKFWPSVIKSGMKINEPIPEKVFPSPMEFVNDDVGSMVQLKVPEISSHEALIIQQERPIIHQQINFSSIEQAAMTDQGPVVFPSTGQPVTTIRPDKEVIAIIPRGNSGHKKRKLKKKVKTSPVVPFIETSSFVSAAAQTTASISSINDITTKVNAAPTPIYEIIDEPPQDIFLPYRYSDIVSSLSNLTEMSFSISNETDAPPSFGSEQSLYNNYTNDFNQITEFKITLDGHSTLIGNMSETNKQAASVTDVSDKMQVTLPPSIDINNFTLMDNVFSQLKSAVEDRNISRVRTIVQAFDAPAKNINAKETVVNVTVDSAAKRSRNRDGVYLAPRVRNAQNKLKQLKTGTAVHDITSVKVMDATTEISTTIKSSSIKPKTETTTTVLLTTSVKPIKLKRRIYFAPKVRKVAAQSRQAAKISRRVGTRPLRYN